MRLWKGSVLFLLFAALMPLAADSVQAELGYGRQYYGGWSYYPSRGYYYCRYYYRPAPTYTSYRYHYCIYYPSRPRYVYYYNPYRGHYWGRFDTKGKGNNLYSELAPKDRKADLEDIPETAFPQPGPMPRVPEAKDNVTITPIDVAKLPKGTPKSGS